VGIRRGHLGFTSEIGGESREELAEWSLDFSLVHISYFLCGFGLYCRKYIKNVEFE